MLASKKKSENVLEVAKMEHGPDQHQGLFPISARGQYYVNLLIPQECSFTITVVCHSSHQNLPEDFMILNSWLNS